MSGSGPAAPMTGEGPGRLSDQYAAARSSAIVHGLARDVVSVSGPDAASYLQGECSQDVDDMVPGATAEALLLSPQGKIEALIRVSRCDDGGYVVDTDRGFGPVVVARLERFRLRMRVEITLMEDWACLAVRGPDAANAVVVRAPLVRAPLVLPVDWPGLAGLDLLGPSSEEPTGWVGEPAVACGDEAWEALRIEAGCPVGGRDAVEGSIPAETGLVDRTVSFTKGCYTGQELVARLDARGSKVARRLCGLVVDPAGATVGEGQSGDDQPPVGAAVWTADGGHDVGRLSSVAWSPGLGANVALAMVHRRVDLPGPVVLRWDSPGGDRTRGAEARPLALVS